MHSAYTDCIPDIEHFIERKCTDSWKIDEDVTTFHDLSYIISGRAVFYVDTVAYEVKAGDLLYIPPGRLRSAVTDKKNLMAMFSANFNWIFPENCRKILPFPVVTHIGFSNNLNMLYNHLNQLWLEKKDGYTMQARALFVLILSTYLNSYYGTIQDVRTDPRIQKVKSYILNNYEKHLSVSLLADGVHLSANYLGTLFKEVEGCSLNQYINKVRVNNAEALIINENLSVSEAAEACGFSDAFYFSKVFKQLKGHPPSHINFEKNKE